MMNNKGFSLVELQVAIIVAAILVISIGTVSRISALSYNKLQSEAQVYNDLTYGFKLIRNRVRQSTSVPTIVPRVEPEWVEGQQLVVGNSAFGLYRADGSSNIDFIFLEDVLDENNRDVIFSVENTDTINLSLTATTSVVTVSIEGEKKIKGQERSIPFDLSTTIQRRAT